MTKISIVPQSSVLFSAVISSAGGSSRIIQGCHDNIWRGFISENIKQEVARNLKIKYPNKESSLEDLIEYAHLKIVGKITSERIENYKDIIKDIDDAHVLALTKQVKADFLITLDQAHFIRDKQVAIRSGINIMIPKNFLKLMRNQGIIN